MSVQYVAGAAIKLLFSLTRKKKLGLHIAHAAPQPTSTQTKQNRKTASVVRQCWALKQLKILDLTLCSVSHRDLLLEGSAITIR